MTKKLHVTNEERLALANQLSQLSREAARLSFHVRTGAELLDRAGFMTSGVKTARRFVDARITGWISTS